MRGNNRDVLEQVHCEIIRNEVTMCVATSDTREQVQCEIMRDEVAMYVATSEMRSTLPDDERRSREVHGNKRDS